MYIIIQNTLIHNRYIFFLLTFPLGFFVEGEIFAMVPIVSRGNETKVKSSKKNSKYKQMRTKNITTSNRVIPLDWCDNIQQSV